MTVSSATAATRNPNETNQLNIGTGKDSVTAYLASITNPITQHLHDEDVFRGSAEKEDVERDYSTFCAGRISGIFDMAKNLTMPESPEESVRRVWQQYQQVQPQLQQLQQAAEPGKARRIA